MATNESDDPGALISKMRMELTAKDELIKDLRNKVREVETAAFKMQCQIDVFREINETLMDKLVSK